MPLTSCDILLVEDEEKDIELTLVALESHHVANKVHVARDGVEALEFLAACEAKQAAGTAALPRLILLDLKLPRLDGFQVLEKIRSNPATKIIPVVVLTSSAQDQDMLRSYLNGVNSYLQKPVKFEQFCQTVKEIGFYWLLMNKIPVGRLLQAGDSRVA